MESSTVTPETTPLQQGSSSTVGVALKSEMDTHNRSNVEENHAPSSALLGSNNHSTDEPASVLIQQGATDLGKTMTTTITHVTSSSSVLSSSIIVIESPLLSATRTSSASSMEVNETSEEKGKIVSPSQSTLKPTKLSDSETTAPQDSQGASFTQTDNSLSPVNGMLHTSSRETTETMTALDNIEMHNNPLVDKEGTDAAHLEIVNGESNVTNCTGSSNLASEEQNSIDDIKLFNVSSNDSVTATEEGTTTATNATDATSNNSSSGHTITGSKENKSVFVRLSNRINVLEVNMTLFDSYLDQISQRWVGFVSIF